MTAPLRRAKHTKTLASRKSIRHGRIPNLTRARAHYLPFSILRSAIGSRKLREALKAKAASEAGDEVHDVPHMSLKDSFAFVSANPQIRCLALCAMAHGVSTNLMEFAWKTHLRMLHPTPASYSATMGDIATATGVLTGLLMLVSPTIFTRLGWKGAAQANPKFLFWGGLVFFGMAIARSVLVPAGVAVAHGAAGALATAPLLKEVVLLGGILYVVSRASKYALFKPVRRKLPLGPLNSFPPRLASAFTCLSPRRSLTKSLRLTTALHATGGGDGVHSPG